LSQSTTIILGAIAGFTIFLGLPVARMRGLSTSAQGFLNAIATGILIFLLWDVISKANEPVQKALDGVHQGHPGTFVALVAILVGGLGLGLLSLVYFNNVMLERILRKRRAANGPGALAVDRVATRGGVGSPTALALMIAVGLGLHNFSEGLAIGQSAASGAISFALVLIIGFGLHNITEGFGIAAPLASAEARPSWGFLFLAGLIGGGPTFLGTVVGYSFTSTYVFVLFLSLAAGALIYVIGEMFAVGRRMNIPATVGWGILLGFAAGYGTDLLLTFAGS
jgi:zinc transporter, ZIP family